MQRNMIAFNDSQDDVIQDDSNDQMSQYQVSQAQINQYQVICQSKIDDFSMSSLNRLFACLTKNPFCYVIPLMLLCLSGCENRIDQFTAGKLESLCRVSIPICQTRVTCVLEENQFISGDFPGSQSILLYAEHPKNKLKIKLLLSEQVYPGTELLLRVYDIGCASLQEEQLKNIDLFMRAGDDQILDFEFELSGLGDHLIEIFSDMNAHYQLTVELEPQFAQ